MPQSGRIVQIQPWGDWMVALTDMGKLYLLERSNVEWSRADLIKMRPIEFSFMEGDPHA